MVRAPCGSMGEALRTINTLWFWNSEIGWAKAHPALEMHGWQYEETVVWDKGIAHIAGNVNSRTIRGIPVVTELAVRYTRKLTLQSLDGVPLPMKEWLRSEWQRSGLPMSQSNKACNSSCGALLHNALLRRRGA
jgi:hypothetical protein